MDERYPDGVKNPRKQQLPFSLVPYLTAPRKRSLSAFIILIIALVLFGIVIAQVFLRYARYEDELERYEALWESQNIENYQYQLEVHNWRGTAKFTVRVEDNIPVTGRYEGAVSEVLPGDISCFDTIPDMFGLAREKLAAKEELKRGNFQLTINYDDDFGFPKRIMLAHPQSFSLRRDYFSFRIDDFQLLESPDDRYARLAVELDEAEKTWESLGLTGYEYTLITGVGDSFIRNRVAVKNGIPYIDPPVISSPEYSRGMYTIPDIFYRIRKAITNREGDGFYQLRIQYDTATGCPVYFGLRDSYMISDPAVYSCSIVDFKSLDE